MGGDTSLLEGIMLLRVIGGYLGDGVANRNLKGQD